MGNNWMLKKLSTLETIIPDSDFSLGEATIIFKGEDVILAT